MQDRKMKKSQGIVVLLVVCSVATHITSADGTETNKADFLSLGQARAVCSTSRMLKGVYVYVASAVDEYQKKYDEVEMIRDVARLKVLGRVTLNLRCGLEAAFLLYIQDRLNVMRASLEKLRRAATKAAGSAGIAAGRLDEFISIFKQSHGKTGHDKNCAGVQGNVVDDLKLLLKECYKGSSSKDYFHEVDDGIVAPTFNNFDEALTSMLKTQVLEVSDAGAGGDADNSRSCHLAVINATESYVNESTPTNSIRWGAGVLQVNAGEPSKAVWSTNPSVEVPVFRDASTHFKEFREALNEIRQVYIDLKEDWTMEKVSRSDIQGILSTLKRNRFEQNGTFSFRRLSSLDDATRKNWLPEWNDVKINEKVLEEELALCEGKNGVDLVSKVLFSWLVSLTLLLSLI
uniref:Uncharacterized protein TCIL3000_1_100 n=1 Tax=Trypanosoma congolense (strain IL3000) TaxID=1068625 RepID=G0UIQ2_TRYCI|nr:unnamed protein product [Trypanosoma congolense IL3000]